MKADLLDNGDVVSLACHQRGNGRCNLRLPTIDGIESVMLQPIWLGWLDQTGGWRAS